MLLVKVIAMIAWFYIQSLFLDEDSDSDHVYQTKLLVKCIVWLFSPSEESDWNKDAEQR